MKIRKTHPALRQRFQRGNKYHFFRCGAILHSHTLVDIYVTMSSLVPPPPTPPVPCDGPSPPRLRTLPSPDHRPPHPILRLIVVSLLPHPPLVVSSPWLSVDCCFNLQTRLMLPPMASSSMSAAAIVFHQYRPMPLSSYDAPLSAVNTDRCRLRQAAVAFVVLLPLPAIVVQCCRCCRMLPSLKDTAIVEGRCRRRRTLPSS